MIICHSWPVFSYFRAGKYTHKPGTTGVLTTSVKKVEFDIVSTEVQEVTPMDTA